MAKQKYSVHFCALFLPINYLFVIFGLTVKAIPTVAENDPALNSPVLNLTKNDVFPTPESPNKIV